MTCSIPLNRGIHAYVDDADYKRISGYTWTIFISGNNTYAVTSIDGCLVFMHRMVLNYYDSEDIDHKNRNGIDNRKSNLWVAGRTNNNLNRNAVTGVKVRHNVNNTVYDARVQYEGVSYHLGTFRTYERAVRMSSLNRNRLLRGLRPIAYKADYPRGPRYTQQL